MNRLFSAIAILLTLALAPVYLNAAEPVQHDLRIVLYPGENRFTAKDMVTVPGDVLSELRFLLHRGLAPTTPTPGVRLVKETEKSRPIPLESFRIILARPEQVHTRVWWNYSPSPRSVRHRTGSGLSADTGFDLRRGSVSFREFVLVSEFS
jgi:hypothetical protein